MADYKSTHTGEEIDAGINKAVTAESNWSLLMANLGIGRWRDVTFQQYYSGNQINDSLLPYYSSYAATFYNMGFVDINTNELKNNPITMTSSTYISGDKAMVGTFAYLRNTTDLTINIDGNTNVFSANYCFLGANITSVTFKDITNQGGTLNPVWFSYGFKKCSNLVSVDGLSMTNPSSFWSNISWQKIFDGCSKLKHVGITHIKLSLSISDSTAFEESDLVEIISNLDTVTTTQTLTMGTTNLAKLTDDEKKVATDKGWVLA